MSDAIRVSAPITGGDKEMSFEAGELAQLADGAVVARIGDTMILVTSVANRNVRDGIDFFPLTVDIEERAYAAGKIPGAFFRREGKPSDQAVLICRLIDRPLRPSFPKGFRNEVQVVGTVFSADMENPHDVLAINAASASLMLSGIPFEGPIGAVRLAFTTDGEWIAHPTYQDGDKSVFEIVVAGRALSESVEADIAIMMVEAGGTEGSFEKYADGAKKVDEDVLADGLERAKIWIRESINLQRELVREWVAQKGPIVPIAYSVFTDYADDVMARVVAVGEGKIAAANAHPEKAVRAAALDAATAEIVAELAGEFADRSSEIKAAVKSLTKKIVRRRIVEDGVRIDGRSSADIRPLSARVDLFPKTHGSALFQRGDTQVVNVTTLGMPRMRQQLDTLSPDEFRRYMHHYNFPPYSVGEAGRVGVPKRREIGHGMLAERALIPVLPSEEEFNYAIRVVSDIMASNGSTSMASVCGSTLSLMAAGVPIKAPVAGIAMGLIYDGGTYVTLTDILGAEDAFGDMDFKVAGTADAVTALQLDTKIDGLPAEVLAKALHQAKDARLKILQVINDTLDAPRTDVAEVAPKIVSFAIPVDKIGEVIGPKGKVINTLQQETGADITVDDDGAVGIVTIGSTDGRAVEEARRRIELILDPPTAEVGAVYQGKIVNIAKFGAFVNIIPGRDGLLHISKMSPLNGGKRIGQVEDVVSLGQPIEVRVDDIDPQGKVSLSLVGYEDVAPSGESGSSDSAPRGERRPERSNRPERAERQEPSGAPVASFEDSFEAELADELGDLGPGGPALRDDAGRDNRPRRPRRR